MHNSNQSYLIMNLCCAQCTKAFGHKLFPLASSYHRKNKCFQFPKIKVMNLYL